MVDQRLVGGLVVVGAAIATLLIGRALIQVAGGEAGPEEPLPPEETGTPTVQAGTLGSVAIEVTNVQRIAPDNYIIETRYSNLSNDEQTFEAIMQIKDPNNQVQAIKSTGITIPGRSSRSVRFSTGNVFKLATIRGIWTAQFFAWQSFDVPVPLADDISQEFIADVIF